MSQPVICIDSRFRYAKRAWEWYGGVVILIVYAMLLKEACDRQVSIAFFHARVDILKSLLNLAAPNLHFGPEVKSKLCPRDLWERKRLYVRCRHVGRFTAACLSVSRLSQFEHLSARPRPTHRRMWLLRPGHLARRQLIRKINLVRRGRETWRGASSLMMAWPKETVSECWLAQTKAMHDAAVGRQLLASPSQER